MVLILRAFVGDVSNYSISEVTVKCCFPFIVINADSGDNPQPCVYVTWSVEELPELYILCSSVQLPEPWVGRVPDTHPRAWQ